MDYNDAGISKHVLANKEEFAFSKLLFTVLTATVIGGVAGLVVGGDWRISLLAGYAGIIICFYKMQFRRTAKR